MLWRVRATLPDRPGALAALAAECGASAVNILGFQIFPGVALVTDELVLDTPEGWQPADVQALVERSHGEAVSVVPCTEAALADQPTRYVQAAAAVLASPASFPDVLARLFDAEAEPPTGGGTLDVLEVTVASVLVQVRRGAPFTATEHTRAAALASLVDDVLTRAAPLAPSTATPTGTGDRVGARRRRRARCGPWFTGRWSAARRSRPPSTNPTPACWSSRSSRPGGDRGSAVA